jgi:hypothetical protein
MQLRSGTVTTGDLSMLDIVTVEGTTLITPVGTDGREARLLLPGALASASLDFTDGDTFKRFTVTDTNVATTSLILVGVRRANVEDVDDYGWQFTANVVKIAAGSFDVNVSALVQDGIPAPGEWPSETVTLVYSVQ